MGDIITFTICAHVESFQRKKRVLPELYIYTLHALILVTTTRLSPWPEKPNHMVINIFLCIYAQKEIYMTIVLEIK